jgi:DNA transposition AAA+ family ATPase
MKEKAREKLEKRIAELEGLISREGVGSDYIQKARRVQRDLNIGLMLGAATTIVGIAAWALLGSDEE